MFRRIQGIALAVMTFALASPVALAHPGHGVIPADQPAHWFEPIHAAPLVISVLAIALYVWRRSRSNS